MDNSALLMTICFVSGFAGTVIGYLIGRLKNANRQIGTLKRELEEMKRKQ